MKTILITGANGNLGTEVTKNLYKKGYNILATIGRSSAEPELQKMTQNIQMINLTDESETQQYVNEITQNHPNLKAAVLLVGGFALGDFEETDSTAIDKQVSLNFKSAYFIVRPLIKYFEKNGGGQFVFIGARPALDAEAGKNMLAYALSKAMVMHLVELINDVGRGKNISATVIIPSIIDTPANKAGMPDADFSKWVKASDIAETIAFILSDTGQNIRETTIKMYNEA
ncbi:MAG: SDR family NAD(P)-dependent oxidoreductase [Saprospiraceae bacterium]